MHLYCAFGHFPAPVLDCVTVDKALNPNSPILFKRERPGSVGVNKVSPLAKTTGSQGKGETLGAR